MALLPPNKPARGQQDVLHFLKDKTDISVPLLLAVRGYFRDSMGVKFKNDRRIYDDAVFIVTPTAFASFNFNTDPNGYREGSGFGSKKGMAMLKAGIWDYQPGIHKGYQAFTQAGKVTVVRDSADGGYEDTGYFGINIHRGGATSTSSIGCCTVPAGAQWDGFKSLFYSELSRHRVKKFKFVLVNESDTGWND